jgi:hypothetical protein
MTDRSMDALIIRHLEDFEDAYRCAYKLDNEIWKLLGAAAQKWAEDKGWDFGFDFEKDEFWTAPQGWKLPRRSEGEQDWLAYFEFDAGPDDDWGDGSAEFDLLAVTRLCQATKRGKVGFRWRSDYFAAGNKVAWRGFVNKSAEQIAQKTGLTYENKSGRFYLPMTVDIETLAKAVEEDAIDDALFAPTKSALDGLAAAEPMLTQLLTEAKKEFKK